MITNNVSGWSAFRKKKYHIRLDHRSLWCYWNCVEELDKIVTTSKLVDWPSMHVCVCVCATNEYIIVLTKTRRKSSEYHLSDFFYHIYAIFFLLMNITCKSKQEQPQQPQSYQYLWLLLSSSSPYNVIHVVEYLNSFI